MRFSSVFSVVGVGLCVFSGVSVLSAHARPYTKLVTIIETGQAAPGGGTFTRPSNVLAPLTLSSTGAVAFRGETTGGPTAAVYVGDGTTMTRILAVGDVVGSNTITGFGALSDNPYINAGGDVVIRATLSGASTSGVLRYTNATGAISTVATNTTVVPTFNPNNVTYGTLGRATINDSGTIAFTSVNGLFTQTSSGTYDAPIMIGSLGSTGAPGVGVYSTVVNARINNAGVIVHNGTGDGVNKMIQIDAGFTDVIASIGGAAPGGGTFTDFGTENGYISGDSRFATFYGSTTDTVSPNALFRWDTQANSLVRVVAENQATGFGGFWNGFDLVAVTNDNGLTLFSARIEDETGTAINAGLFATDGSTTTKVLGFLDEFKGGTLDALGANYALNNANQFAFNYRLTDGRSGIVRADIAVAVPEPGAGLLACAALPLCLLGRRRREKSQIKRG